MDMESYGRLARDPLRTKKELMAMHANAVQKNRPELVAIAAEELERRFPGWQKTRTRQSGSRPTVVRFRDCTEDLPSEVSAYLWLLNKFLLACPDVLNRLRRSNRQGRGRPHFAESRSALFPGNPGLASDPSMSHRLPNGWYADINLKAETKYNCLLDIAHAAGIAYRDWDWGVEGRMLGVELDELLGLRK